MIDPEDVRTFGLRRDSTHLLTEVVTDMKDAANALRWCVRRWSVAIN